MPPLDWDVPSTFTVFDRKAWEIVEDEAEQGETDRAGSTPPKSISTLKPPGAWRASLRSALSPAEIRSDRLCADRGILDGHGAGRRGPPTASATRCPAAICSTAAHGSKPCRWRGYFQKPNDIYSYLLPIFSPIAGLTRLGTQQWMVKPAWKNMQQNLLPLGFTGRSSTGSGCTSSNFTAAAWRSGPASIAA